MKILVEIEARWNDRRDAIAALEGAGYDSIYATEEAFWVKQKPGIYNEEYLELRRVEGHWEAHPVTFMRKQDHILNKWAIWENLGHLERDYAEVSSEHYPVHAAEHPDLFVDAFWAFVAKHPPQQWSLTIGNACEHSPILKLVAKRKQA